MAQIDEILKSAVSQGASDIHFATNEPIRFRMDGDLVTVSDGPLPLEHIRGLFAEIMNPNEQERFEEQHNLDKSYSVPGVGNFRVNVFQTRTGISAVLRTIPTKIPTIEGLGLPDVLKTLTEHGQGLILVTGPTGSGKSTTLAAMINYINHHHPYHILTAEDPVEFVHPSKQSLINQREIGQSCPSFADALKYALREDPDVILVGEMRDLETIGLAMTAAETGHLVFGTLHTRGAAASIDRIIDSFPANQQPMIRAMLSESLRAVISQALLKKIGGGRVAAYEIMVVNHAISNLIREGKTFQIPSVIQTGKKDGMVLMDQHLRDLVAGGLTSYDEAIGYTENPQALQGLQGRGGSAPAPKKTAAKVAANISVPTPVAARPAPPPGGQAPGHPIPPPSPAASPPGASPPGAPPPPQPVQQRGAGFAPQPLKLGDQTQAQFDLKSQRPMQPPPPSQVPGGPPPQPPGPPRPPGAPPAPPAAPAGGTIELDDEVSRMDISLPEGDDEKKTG